VVEHLDAEITRLGLPLGVFFTEYTCPITASFIFCGMLPFFSIIMHRK